MVSVIKQEAQDDPFSADNVQTVPSLSDLSDQDSSGKSLLIVFFRTPKNTLTKIKLVINVRKRLIRNRIMNVRP